MTTRRTAGARARRPKPPSARPTIDVSLASKWWARALPRIAAICRRAAETAWHMGADRALRRRSAAAEISIVLTGDAAIRKLNATYRGKDKATNVLSFPTMSWVNPAEPGPLILGDVVVAYATTAREAKDADKSLKDHLSHMVVHGVLHLLGYDHETSSDAKTMERLETKILAALGIADPYRTQAAPAHKSRRGPRTAK